MSKFKKKNEALLSYKISIPPESNLGIYEQAQNLMLSFYW